MNADGSSDVATVVTAGATVPALDGLVPTLLSIAGTGLVIAVLSVTLRRG